MKLRIFCCVLLFCCFGVYVAAQHVAPDATPIGPLPTASGEYDLGAQSRSFSAAGLPAQVWL